MIDLAELVGSTTGQIDNQTSTEVVFNFKHVAYHRCEFAGDDLLGQLTPFFLSEHALVSISENRCGICLALLFAERDGEYVILYALQKLGQAADGHIDLLLVVVSAVHALQDIFGDVEEITK